MPGVEVTSNVGAYKAALREARLKALEVIGRIWRDDAAEKDTFDYWPDEIAQSISYVVDVDKNTVSVGSSMEVAAYAELGTGKEYSPPPDYIENRVQKGTIVPAGIEHWIYYDPLKKQFLIGAPQKAMPFLSTAFEENKERFMDVWKGELGKVDINTNG